MKVSLLLLAMHALPFEGTHSPLPQNVEAQMRRYSWKPSCPVPLSDLFYLEVSHWGFDGEVKKGQLVVHRLVAPEVVEIFKALYEVGFPIEKMRLIDDYQGSDDASMADNNTSAFNCRPIPDRPSVYSNHSYGLAIDLNPLLNPYVTSKGVVIPPDGVKYLDRKKPTKGFILQNDAVVQAFARHGWKWGGNWRTSSDYQHFDKKLSLNRKERKVKEASAPL